MDIQEAKNIADKYCAGVSEHRRAIYSGVFDGGYLFRLSFQGSGHHGSPLFLVINPNGAINYLEKHSDIYNKAWHASDDYLDSLSCKHINF